MAEIDKRFYLNCRICGMTTKEIKREMGGSGFYVAQAFKKHMCNHNITLKKYFVDYCDMEIPLCACGICGKELDITTKKMNKSGLYWKDYACGRNIGIMKWAEKAKDTRKGINNPMFGKVSWNKNKNKYNCPIMKKNSEDRKGIVFSEKTKKRQSDSAKIRKVHGHTGKKHTDEAKRKISINTIKSIKAGLFRQTKTKPHIAMGKLLASLKINFEEEKGIDVWSFDFYLIEYDILLEVDGDYFHSNPKIYPNGPITKTQKVNAYRDIKKNYFCSLNEIKLLRFWESDILTNPEKVKEQILCSLKK